MSRGPRHLPPLKSLAAFEAAARHLSFKGAAADLNVTPSAISHQIKALEDELDVALFTRVHRGIVLTDAGAELHAVVKQSFRDLWLGVAQARRARADRNVTISATTAMSAFWLTPRLSRLWREYPDIRIDQIVSDTRDTIANSADIHIIYGPDGHPDRVESELFNDVLIPVAAQEFRAIHRITTLEELATGPLIHLNAPDQNWTTWQSWLSELGYSGPIASGRRVNNYMIALQTAADGVGIALGWQRLAERFLALNDLKPIAPFSMTSPSSFYLSMDRRLLNHPEVMRVWEWLLLNP